MKETLSCNAVYKCSFTFSLPLHTQPQLSILKLQKRGHVEDLWVEETLKPHLDKLLEKRKQKTQFAFTLRSDGKV